MRSAELGRRTVDWGMTGVQGQSEKSLSLLWIVICFAHETLSRVEPREMTFLAVARRENEASCGLGGLISIQEYKTQGAATTRQR